jgi:hypothetical protein
MNEQSFQTQLSVNLLGGRILNTTVNIEHLTERVVHQSMMTADQFVQAFLEAEMERCEYLINPTTYSVSKLNDGYRMAQDYMIPFGVDMLDYLKMVDDGNWKPIACAVIEDAMIISRLVRDILMQEWDRRIKLDTPN